MARRARSQRAQNSSGGAPGGPGRNSTRTRGRGNNRRRLSQNFLTDPGAARHVVRVAGVGPHDQVVEVGPGDGALTRFLAPVVRRVLAYEIDARLARRLSERYRGSAHEVRVVHSDFTRTRPPGTEFALVGNIPYSRTADIVRWCLSAPALTSATLVTQLEYARKRTGGYGRWTKLTVQTWPEWSWTLAGRIPRNRFFPAPRVDSGVLVLRRRTTALLPPQELAAYRQMVDLGFGGAGGSLKASLRSAYPAQRVARALRAARVAPDTPVGRVSPDQWLQVFCSLHA